MKTLLICLIIISLFVMTTLIVIGIVKTVRGQESKKFLVSGMVTGIIPLIMTCILFFFRLKGLL